MFRDYLPLAIEIREAVYAAWPDVPRTAVSHALARHCRSDRYLQGIAGQRHGFVGHGVGR